VLWNQARGIRRYQSYFRFHEQFPKQEGATDNQLRPSETSQPQRLAPIAVAVAVAIVVVIIPVTLGMPAMTVFIPPLVSVHKAILTRLAQIVARAFRLSTSPAVAFGSFVHPMVGSCDAPLAFAFIGAKPWCTGEKQSTCQRSGRERRPYPK
jgi:hypothetical protein